MFLDLDKKNRAAVAVIDDSGQSITYGDICDFSKKFHEYLPKRALSSLIIFTIVSVFIPQGDWRWDPKQILFYINPIKEQEK